MLKLKILYNQNDITVELTENKMPFYHLICLSDGTSSHRTVSRSELQVSESIYMLHYLTQNVYMYTQHHSDLFD